VLVLQDGPKHENQRYNDGGRQSRSEDTDGPIGMIDECAIGNRCKPAGANDACVEQRESAADVPLI
jgi:hypothetical protein